MHQIDGWPGVLNSVSAPFQNAFVNTGVEIVKTGREIKRVITHRQGSVGMKPTFAVPRRQVVEVDRKEPVHGGPFQFQRASKAVMGRSGVLGLLLQSVYQPDECGQADGRPEIAGIHGDAQSGEHIA